MDIISYHSSHSILTNNIMHASYINRRMDRLLRVPWDPKPADYPSRKARPPRDNVH